MVITPSHNPPDNGGIKYNPPTGGPADTDATGWIAARANELLGESGYVGPAMSAHQTKYANEYDRIQFHRRIQYVRALTPGLWVRGLYVRKPSRKPCRRGRCCPPPS